MDTALKVSQIGASLGYPITCVGVPKTVDNDLPHTDCCPGFGSVAKYVAVSTREAALDVASMARTSTKVFVLEVMGRHAGWIAAAGGLAGRGPAEPPHIILFPEMPFEQQKFLERVRAVRHRLRLLRRSSSPRGPPTRTASSSPTPARAMPSATPSSAASRRWSPTWCARRTATSITGRWPTTCSAAARHIASQVDVEQAYAVGKAAVELARQGRERGDADHRAQVLASPTAGASATCRSREVANKEKKVPREYIRADGFGITAACRRYLEPLIGGEAYPPYRDGLPDYVHIKGVPVRRKLTSEFKV